MPSLGAGRVKRQSIAPARITGEAGTVKAELKECKKILRDLLNHPSAWPFARPVDIIKYPDYYNAITRPMDLGTIKAQNAPYPTPTGDNHARAILTPRANESCPTARAMPQHSVTPARPPVRLHSLTEAARWWLALRDRRCIRGRHRSRLGQLPHVQ